MEKSWGVAQNYPKALPFYSNFDQVKTAFKKKLKKKKPLFLLTSFTKSLGSLGFQSNQIIVKA